MAIHEALFDETRARGGGRGDAIDVRRIERDRLFAQHVLAGRDRRQRPGHVIGVRQGNVDRVDARVIDDRLIPHHRARDLATLAHAHRRGRDRGWRRQQVSLRRASRIAGMTRRLMRAVPRMPQRIMVPGTDNAGRCQAPSLFSLQLGEHAAVEFFRLAAWDGQRLPLRMPCKCLASSRI